MKLFLIRHGQTTGDIENRYGGIYDDHLTDLGKKQIEEIANNITDKKIEIIFTSPLKRAKEATEIIQLETKCTVEIVSGLQERNYGILSGLTKDEALEKYPEAVENHKNQLNTDPEGESYQDFKNRVIDTFQKKINRNYETIAIVSHGGPIKQILSYLKKDVPEKLKDGEIIELDII